MTLKEKILKEAFELFSVKGYEKTTISELIERAGTSKGGFYHHFKSKDEVLEEITLSFLSNINSYYDEILEDKEIDILEKFIAPLYHISRLKLDSIPTWPSISNIYNFEGSNILIRKLADKFEESTRNYYYRLIVLGIEYEVFKTDFPYEVASLWAREIINIQAKATKIFFSNDKEQQKKYKSMLEFNEKLIHTLLDLQNNEIEIIKFGLNYVESIKKALNKGDVNND